MSDVKCIISPYFLECQKCTIELYFLATHCENKMTINSLEKAVWKHLAETHLLHEIKRGPSKSPSNSFQIKKLEVNKFEHLTR